MGNATTKDYSRSISIGNSSKKTRWDGPGKSICCFIHFILKFLMILKIGIFHSQELKL